MSPNPWNSINYLSTIVALIMGAGSVWALNRKRVKSDKAEIAFLRKQNALAEEQNNELKAKLEEADKRRDAYEARLPDTAWEKARADWVDGIERKANDTVRDWIDREGDTISQLLLYRAIWAHQNSCGYLRPVGLVAAKAYAAAAVTLWPQNREALKLLIDLGNYMRIEPGGGPSTPLITALTEFDDKAERFVELDPEAANIGENEAKYRYERGHYHLALPVIELALRLRIKAVGEKAAETLRGKLLKASIVLALGHPEKALPIAQSVADDSAIHPTLGPSHPETLHSAFVVALILFRLGRLEEALAKAQAVEQAMILHLGPSHPATLHSRIIIVDILNKLRRNDDKLLAKAQAVEQAMTGHSQFGPSHPSTPYSGLLVARILHALGRNEDALAKAQAVEQGTITHPALGPRHYDTLACGLTVAGILRALGRNEDALVKARAVLKAMIAHPALGPSHHDALLCGRLVADILRALGRSGEGQQNPDRMP